MPRKPKHYYYAGGERVPLAPAADALAVDAKRLAAADLSAAARQEIDTHAGPKLADGIRLVPGSALSPAARAALESAGAVQPVFESAGATLVALPEVRVEESRPAKKRQLAKWLKARGDAVVVR